MLSEAKSILQSSRRVDRISAALLLASTAGLLLLPGAICQQQDAALTASQGMTLRGQVRYSRISPPEAGVRLLEEVFQRVRSAPQVAIKTNNIMQQQQKAMPAQQGPTDYRLAIRPKQLGKTVALPSPSIALLPPSATGDSGNTLAGAFGSGGSMMTSTSRSVGGLVYNNGNGYQSGGTTTLQAPAEPSALSESWLGNKNLPLVANAQTPRSGVWEAPQNSKNILDAMNGSGTGASSGASADVDALGDLPPVGAFVHQPGDGFSTGRAAEKPAAKRSHAGRGKPDSNIADRRVSSPMQSAATAAKAPDLATATSRLLGALNGIDNAQRMAQQPAERQQTRLRANEIVQTAARDFDRTDRSETTALKGKAKDKSSAKEEIATALAPTGAIAMSPPSAASTRAKKSRFESKAQLYDDELAKDSKFPGRNKQLAMAGDNLALLPPNVVTGIPLIRLGISESQANSALMAMGNLKQQKLNKWTVLTWQRPATKSTALQLYIRNGLLDAMRIFDASLIAPDFGVTLGEPLSKVKEKFGEPAFILSEPQPGAGQNYIYPISQVGFQLARPAPNQQPRVVSVLIFNVK